MDLWEEAERERAFWAQSLLEGQTGIFLSQETACCCLFLQRAQKQDFVGVLCPLTRDLALISPPRGNQPGVG